MPFNANGEDWILANLAIDRAAGGGWDYACISKLPIIERRLRAAIQAGHVRLRARSHLGINFVEIPTPLTGAFRLDLGIANELTLGLGMQSETFTNLEIEWGSAEPHLRTVSTTRAKTMEPVPPRAAETEIRNALQAVYDEAEHRRQKPPNLTEVVRPVQTKLAEQGFSATKRQVQGLADEPAFKQRRLKCGHHL
jgi:hypothetical protein